MADISELFTCARCGSCCRGETTVSLDEGDQERMAAHLGLTVEEAERRYWRVTPLASGRMVQMRVVDGHCVFFDDNRGCTVHAGRPWRCRQWPLHPSILLDEANFSAIAASCPGLNAALGYAEFCRIFRTVLDAPASAQSPPA